MHSGSCPPPLPLPSYLTDASQVRPTVCRSIFFASSGEKTSRRRFTYRHSHVETQVRRSANKKPRLHPLIFFPVRRFSRTAQMNPNHPSSVCLFLNSVTSGFACAPRQPATPSLGCVCRCAPIVFRLYLTYGAPFRFREGHLILFIYARTSRLPTSPE